MNSPQLRRSGYAIIVVVVAMVAGAYSLVLAAGAPAMARDITPAQVSSTSTPSRLTSFGNSVLFWYADPVNGGELHISDGTTAGTRMIQNLTSGTGSSEGPITAGTSVAYFITGNRVYVTRGQTNDIQMVCTTCVADYYSPVVTIGDRAFFIASDANTAEVKLWVSDGSAATTQSIATVSPYTIGDITLVRSGSKVYFLANDGSKDRLWVSDGTAAGSVMLPDLTPNSGDEIRFLTDVGGTLFFALKQGTSQLWKTDGTQAGTVRVGSTTFNELSELTNVQGTLFFRGNVTDYSSGPPRYVVGIWKSDAASTIQIKELYRGTDLVSIPNTLRSAGNLLFFNGNGGVWVSDGTEAGTKNVASVLIKEITPTFTTAVGNRFFFSANRGTGTDTELWISDGTSAGTKAIAMPAKVGGSTVNVIAGMASVPGAALVGINGTLLRIDATTLATSSVLASKYGVSTFDRSEFIGQTTTTPLFVFGNKVLFPADAQSGKGLELWVSDGTSAGTIQLDDFNAGTGSSFPSHFTPFNGALYYIATSGSNNYLRRTDGTSANTVSIKTFSTVTDRIVGMGQVNGSLVFVTVVDGTTRVWKSDGTAAGTTVIKTITTVKIVSPLFTVSNNKAYFMVNDAANGTEPWVSDGTAAGTMLLKDTATGTTGANISQFVATPSGVAFFSYGELWKSNGTTAGTSVIKSFPQLDSVAGPDQLTASGTKLFFTVFDATSGREVWVSDGTAAGTTVTADLNTCSTDQKPSYNDNGSSSPEQLTPFNGKLLFTATTCAYGRELWISDGSAAGTKLVKDFIPGAESSPIIDIKWTSGNVAYLSGVHPAAGTELWQTDGSESGTQQIADIVSGSGSSSPFGYVQAGTRLFFVANTVAYGDELWSVALNETVATTPLPTFTTASPTATSSPASPTATAQPTTTQTTTAVPTTTPASSGKQLLFLPIMQK